MKIISTVHKLLFFKRTDLCTWDTKIWKIILSSYESEIIMWICRQPKSQLRIRSGIWILLEIIPNVFKCLTVLLSTQILNMTIALLLFISVSILCEFAMLTFYRPLRKSAPLLPGGTDGHIWQTSTQLLCTTASSLVLLVQTFDNWTCSYQFHFWGFVQTDPLLSFEQYFGSVKWATHKSKFIISPVFQTFRILWFHADISACICLENVLIKNNNLKTL